jgi:hypothetical protein
MARKWESNEPQREREVEQTWEEKRQELIGANGSAATIVAEEEIPSPPLRLSDDDLAYHQRAHAEWQAAQQRFVLANGVMDSWWRHLRAKYGLAETDDVNAEGMIRRAVFAESESQ